MPRCLRVASQQWSAANVVTSSLSLAALSSVVIAPEGSGRRRLVHWTLGTPSAPLCTPLELGLCVEGLIALEASCATAGAQILAALHGRLPSLLRHGPRGIRIHARCLRMDTSFLWVGMMTHRYEMTCGSVETLEQRGRPHKHPNGARATRSLLCLCRLRHTPLCLWGGTRQLRAR